MVRTAVVFCCSTFELNKSVTTAPVRHSGQLHVVGRFSLDPKTMRITREYTAEDLVYLKGKEQAFIDCSKQAGR